MSVEPFVRVPRALLRAEVAAIDVAIWVLLERHRDWSAPARAVWPNRDTLMQALGREGREASAVSRATTRLARGGWLTKGHARRGGRTVAYYRLHVLADGEAYVTLPRHKLDGLAEGGLTPGDVVELLRWVDAAGGNGRTSDSLAGHARRYRMDVTTARRHRSRLVSQGLLHSVPRSGGASETRVPWLAEEPDQFTGGPRAGMPAHPGQECQPTPGRSARAPRAEVPEDPGQKCLTERTPVERTPEGRTPAERVVPQSSGTSLTDAAGSGRMRTDGVDAIAAAVANRLDCPLKHARLVVERVQLDRAPTNLRHYIAALEPEDLRKVLHALPTVRLELHKERQARQAAEDATRPGAGAVPASDEVRTSTAAAIRAQLRERGEAS